MLVTDRTPVSKNEADVFCFNAQSREGLPKRFFVLVDFGNNDNIQEILLIYSPNLPKISSI